MAEELTYKRLRDMEREEKAQPGLPALPPEFYASVEAFLSSKFSEMESSRSVMQMHEFENAVAVIKEISSIRQQKILTIAIRSGGAHSATGEMTREEHELYDRFCAVLEDARGNLESMLARYGSGKAKNPPKQPQVAMPQPDDAARTEGGSLKKVRFLKEVPAYKGVNNETFGPFSAGQEGALPKNETDWLLKGKLAENLE